MSDPILVGVDTQKPDAAPLHLAARLAQITGAPLIAVAAYTYDPIMDARTGAAVGAELRDEAVDKLAELTEGIEAQRVVAAGRSPARALHDVAAESHAALQVKTESEVVVGDPADALIALSHEVDLLVCGSRGYGPLRAVLLGGVTHRLMRAAHCPVMILPRGTVTRLERLVERQNATTT